MYEVVTRGGDARWLREAVSLAFLSKSDLPMGMPSLIFLKVYAIPPQMMILSADLIRFSITRIWGFG